MDLALLGQNFKCSTCRLLDSGYAIIECELNAMLLHMPLYEERTFPIKWRHDLVEHLDNRHLEPAMDQIFRHLKTDETTTDHHRPLGTLRLDPCVYFPGIRNCSYRKQSGKINSGYRRRARRRTGRGQRSRRHRGRVSLGRRLAGAHRALR